MQVEEDVNIKEYTTFKIGGKFRYFTLIDSLEDLNYIYAIARKELRFKNIPIIILGEGSNLIFSDKTLDVLALKMEIKGFKILKETKKFTDIKIGAGEVLDTIVEKTVKMNLAGLEPLSLIPGTVGATPVQNVGAYGREVKDILLKVSVFDISKNKFIELSNKDCKFKYRDSIFKQKNKKGKYIIVSVTFRLSKLKPKVPNYMSVKKYFSEKKIKNPTPMDIRRAIIHIRKNKLPNPRYISNVGSFFKNPIISKKQFTKIEKERIGVEIPHFEVGDKKIKVPAGWLIEQAGFKGKNLGKISVYDKNALVLINNGGATQKDLLIAKNKIIQKVYKDFGIKLEQEPEMV